MKIKIVSIALLLAMSFISCQNSTSGGKLKTTVDSVSFVMGALDADRVVQSLDQAKLTEVIKMEIYGEAFKDAAIEAELKIDPQAYMGKAQKFIKDHREMQMQLQNDSTGTIPEFTATNETVDSISYILGASDGQRLIGSFSRMGIDTLIKMDYYLDAFTKVTRSEDIGIVAEDNMEMVDNFFKAIQEDRMKAEEAKMEEQWGAHKKEGEDFLAENKKRDGVVVTESGLQYEVIKEGNGEKPVATSKVLVHYHGTLINGTVFDSSVDRGEPIDFPLNGVIKGWTEGLQYMSVGSKYKFYIPYDLAYGSREAGAEIKPFSALIFEVELLDILE